MAGQENKTEETFDAIVREQRVAQSKVKRRKNIRKEGKQKSKQIISSNAQNNTRKKTPQFLESSTTRYAQLAKTLDMDPRPYDRRQALPADNVSITAYEERQNKKEQTNEAENCASKLRAAGEKAIKEASCDP
jgi:hypothetical protein